MLAKAQKEKDDLEVIVDKWNHSSKNLGKIINDHMSASDKFGLGYGDYRYSGNLSYENEVSQSVFMCNKSDSENRPLIPRLVKTSEMQAVPPPMTGNYLPSGPDIEIDDSQYTYGPQKNQPIVNESNIEVQHKVWSDVHLSWEYESDSDDENVTVNATNRIDTHSFCNKQSENPRENAFQKNNSTKNKFFKPKGFTVKVKEVSTVGGKWDTAVKSSAGAAKSSSTNIFSTVSTIAKASDEFKGRAHLIIGIQVKQEKKPDGILLAKISTVAEILKSLTSAVLSTLPYTQIELRSLCQDEKQFQGNPQQEDVKFLGRRLITWHCKKQTIVAILQQEAEYVAAASCCGQVFMDSKSNDDKSITFTWLKGDNMKSHLWDERCWLLFKSKKIAQVVSALIKSKNSLVKHFEDMRLCRPSKEYLLVMRVSEVIDFLRRSYIYHALTVSPVVLTTFVEQFWMSAKSKTINNVRHITAKVAGKVVSISEASIRTDLIFDDADGIDTLHKSSSSLICYSAGMKGFEMTLPMSMMFVSLYVNRMYKESVSKQGRKIAKGESSVKRDPLFDVMLKRNIDHMETDNAQSEGRTKEMVDEDKED
ncbi:hypothetical protein Tco_0006098 [Tanacetum coccineum]